MENTLRLYYTLVQVLSQQRTLLDGFLICYFLISWYNFMETNGGTWLTWEPYWP
jgi:hypothetical protein